MSKKNPTLQEVAFVAGVSRSTASRAINNDPKISEQAKQAVDQAIAQLNYVPNRAARSLATNRTDSIGLLVPEPDEKVLNDPFFAATLNGVNKALKSTDLQFVLLFAPRGQQADRVSKYLGNGHIDGAIVVSHHREDNLEAMVTKARIPTVFVGRPFRQLPNLQFVDGNNYQGGMLATQHLIELGHRKIAHISGPQDMSAGVDRLLGWRDSLIDAGLAPGPISQGDFSAKSGEQAMEELLKSGERFDAIFVASDLMASGAMHVLNRRGIQVPNDISIIGYDNLGVAETTVPELSSVYNPVREMAIVATNLLLDMIEHADSAASIQLQPRILDTKLVVRESTVKK